MKIVTDVTFIKLGGGTGTGDAIIESQEEAMRALGILQGFIQGSAVSDASKLPMLDLVLMLGKYILEHEEVSD